MGATQARADDTYRLKCRIPGWMAIYEGCVPLVEDSKEGRGFHHAITGAFLCPTERDFNDKRQVSQDMSLPRAMFTIVFPVSVQP